MGSLDGVIEPIYFLITSIGFLILTFLNYRKVGKSLETIYLGILAVFFIICFFILNFYWDKID
jgi:amino acid transporter